jgi:formate hydrogenlyase subunit 3/multisubunit Na+/H+ antiporter MnhD subunit
VSLFAAGLSLLLAAGVCAAAFTSRPAIADRAFRLLFLAGCAVAAIQPVAVLRGANPGEFRFDAAVPGGAWVFGMDALSAVFLIAILATGAAAAVYGATYLAPERGRRSVHVSHLGVAILIVAMALVVTARAAVPFLIAWETMAVGAYVLVVFEHEREEIRRAGLLYLVATHAGTLALLALFAAWGDGARDLTFASLSEHAPALPLGGAVVLGLALVGFGLKAGIVPLHFWLPEAHAAAPSHVSALMSGVVIKMGIYGLLRVTMLFGHTPAWWGWLLLALGAASGVLGVVWALAQHDLKRLLAYHSVENIGIILLGMGAGAIGVAYDRPTVAVLGFAGATLHTLNHALFKSLLFLGAGSVAHGAGTREIDRLGGLARRMPATAALFLIGSAAIVGLPPLNGFVSEWLVLLALLQSGLGTGDARLAVLAAATLGLIGALALACFAKVVGIVYLGVARTEDAAAAHESPPGMLRPMIGLAGACAAIGLLPVFALPPVLRAGARIAGAPPGVALPVPTQSLTWFALALAAALAGAWLLRSWRGRGVPVARADTWGCGYDGVTARMQYTASSFAQPLLAAFRPVAGIETMRTPTTLSTHAVDPVLGGVLRPAWRAVRRAAGGLRPIQRGRISAYLAYLAAALVTLLLYLLLAGGGP